jgi:hemolysin III
MSDAAPRQKAKVKPRWRGVSHQIACVVALVAGGGLVARAPSEAGRTSALIYTLSLASLFGISAAYHRPTWKPAARQWMRRLDHAAIFVLIAGTYTPLTMALGPADGGLLRAVIWGGALAGVLQSVLWVTAPKPLIAIIYVILGWSIAPYLKQMLAAVGPGPLGLILLGGVFYSAGALIYARRRPDPWPETFGYHEIFHALVCAAAALHFIAVEGVVMRG